MKRLLLSAACGLLVVGAGFLSLALDRTTGFLMLFWPLLVLPPVRSATDESFISRAELVLSLLADFVVYSLLAYIFLWRRARRARLGFL